MQNFLKHSECAESCQSGLRAHFCLPVNVHMLMVLFMLTSGGLCLNCPLPVILTHAVVVSYLILERFAEVISAKAAE